MTRTKGRVIMVMLHLHPTVNDRLSWPSIYVIGCIPPLQKYFMLMMINLVVGRLCTGRLVSPLCILIIVSSLAKGLYSPIPTSEPLHVRLVG